jgi:hypothetical protein
MSDSSGLVADSVVPDGECWFRIIVNSEYVNKGALVLQALKGNAFAATAKAGFSHELSGGLVSQVGDLGRLAIRAEAMLESVRRKWMATHGKVPSKFRYTGVGCAPVIELRPTVAGTIPSNVYFTPIPDVDHAHADFVVRAANEDELNVVRSDLIKRLKFVPAENVPQALPACGG